MISTVNYVLHLVQASCTGFCLCLTFLNSLSLFTLLGFRLKNNHVCVYMFMWVFEPAFVPSCAAGCGSQKARQEFSFISFCLPLGDRVSPWPWSLPFWLDWLPSILQELPVFTFSFPGTKNRGVLLCPALSGLWQSEFRSSFGISSALFGFV